MVCISRLNHYKILIQELPEGYSQDHLKRFKLDTLTKNKLQAKSDWNTIQINFATKTKTH